MLPSLGFLVSLAGPNLTAVPPLAAIVSETRTSSESTPAFKKCPWFGLLPLPNVLSTHSTLLRGIYSVGHDALLCTALFGTKRGTVVPTNGPVAVVVHRPPHPSTPPKGRNHRNINVASNSNNNVIDERDDGVAGDNRDNPPMTPHTEVLTGLRTRRWPVTSAGCLCVHDVPMLAMAGVGLQVRCQRNFPSPTRQRMSRSFTPMPVTNPHDRSRQRAARVDWAPSGTAAAVDWCGVAGWLFDSVGASLSIARRPPCRAVLVCPTGY